ncbi:MAG: hypothetical protein U1D96_11455 [Eubacteriales bacterium]|nr:hypothetical protein [Eubacteriales bacterium]MDZ7610819.1 hypothetical protein [Eubacteriales bacterium]
MLDSEKTPREEWCSRGGRLGSDSDSERSDIFALRVEMGAVA